MSADKSNSLPLRVDVLESNVDLKGMSVIEMARIAYTGGDLNSEVDLKGRSVVELAREAYKSDCKATLDAIRETHPRDEGRLFLLDRKGGFAEADASALAVATMSSAFWPISAAKPSATPRLAANSGCSASSTFSSVTSRPATRHVTMPRIASTLAVCRFICSRIRRCTSVSSWSLIAFLRRKKRRSAESRGARKP